MQRAIEHFVWGYQPHFRGAVERETRRILDSLRPGLDARAFLVGVRMTQERGRPPACVEPEIHHWAHSSEFYDVLKDVAAIQDCYPESQISHSDPLAQEQKDRYLFRRALGDAVLQRLEALPSRPQDVRLFASFPVEREGFLVLIVIAVTRSVFDETPSVSSDQVWIHEYRPVQVPRSLLEAVIDQIHIRASEVLLRPDAGSDLCMLGSAEHILRQASVRFFSGLLYRVDQDGLRGSVAEQVFDELSQLSLAPYEKAVASGRLLFAEKGAAVGTHALTFARPLPLREARALRKMLVLTTEELALRCNSEHAFALVRTTPAETSLTLAVQVMGHGKWAVSVEGRELMIVYHGLPSLPSPVVDEEQLAQYFSRVFRRMTRESAAQFARIGARLAVSGHGSVVVITEAAADEALRLGNESLAITPVALTPDLAQKLSEIDGALLCDPEGRCHAVGAILDGKASPLGDHGRGSRFNSAVRYIDGDLIPKAAMVVSDDGGLDLLPRLRPTVSVSELSSKLDALRELALSPSSPLDRDREIEVIGWIERHAFYLSESQCANANEWIVTCQERFYMEAKIRLMYSRLNTDPNFDPMRDLT